MAYDPKADRFDPQAVKKATARQAARMKVTDKNAGQAKPKSLLDTLPSLLLLDGWRSARAIGFPGWRRQGPRQRPM
jgi:hypothetical protein